MLSGYRLYVQKFPHSSHRESLFNPFLTYCISHHGDRIARSFRHQASKSFHVAHNIVDQVRVYHALLP